MHHPVPTAASLTADARIDQSLAKRIRAAQSDHRVLSERDARRTLELAERTDNSTVWSIPRLPNVVADIGGLARLSTWISEPTSTTSP